MRPKETPVHRDEGREWADSNNFGSRANLVEVEQRTKMPKSRWSRRKPLATPKVGDARCGNQGNDALATLSSLDLPGTDIVAQRLLA